MKSNKAVYPDRNDRSLEESKRLVDCAMGRIPADLVIQNGRWVCVQSGEIIDHTDVSVSGERIAFVGENASHCIGPNTRVINAANRYLVPGLLDAHMHVESTMLTVTEFVRAIIPHGTTGIFVDPHEIANVFGLKGVKLMVDEAQYQPIHVWVQVPSCVPSAEGFETPGAKIGPKEVGEALTWEGIIGLGEVMNFSGIADGDLDLLSEIGFTRSAGKVIGGHYASPDLGLPFHGYVAGGAQDDHECTRLQEGVARLRQGMKLMMRYGSGWKDLAELSRTLTELNLDHRNILLCTDDSHSHTIFNEGHMDRVLRYAIHQGISPIRAVQMATINTADHFGLTQDIGMIAPGRYADILLVPDLEEFTPDMVMAKGKIVSQAGHILVDLPDYHYPAWASKSIHLRRPLQPSDFIIKTDRVDDAIANVIGIIENQAPTKLIKMPVNIDGGEIHSDIEKDICKVAVVERHHGTGRIQLGLTHGFGFTKPCAIASSVAHDSHHIIVVGTDDDCMATAVNKLAETGGGQIVILKGEVCGLVELPIGGLMSLESGQTVARKAANVLAGFQECGCRLNNPNMQLSLLALVVIPEIRISDLGLVDVSKMEFMKLVE